MRKFAAALTSISLLASGCSTTVWRTPGDVTPATYLPEKTGIKRSVGRLRKLAILPVRFNINEQRSKCDDIIPFWRPNYPKKKKEEAFRRTILKNSAKTLSDWKGYEVVPLTEALLKKTGSGLEEAKKELDTLAGWAKKSPDGSPPPEEIAGIISRIGGRYDVDGVVLMQGMLKLPSACTFLLVLGTASVAWPLLFVDGKSAFWVDIYEVSTGNIVWRSRGKGPRSLEGKYSDPFKSIEHALPRVLTRQRTASEPGYE